MNHSILFYATIISSQSTFLLVLNRNFTTARLRQLPLATRVPESNRDGIGAAHGATVQRTPRIEAHRHALLVFDAHLAARRRVLVSGVLLLPQVHSIRAADIADADDVRGEVCRGALGGLGGCCGGCGGVGGFGAVAFDGAGGGGGGELEG